MAEATFKCAFCGEESPFSRRAGEVDSDGSANPYARQTRKYRCEKCTRINDIEKPGYDWSKIDLAK